MTEFGATLQAFIELARFESQSAYAAAAHVSDSTVTRATSGRSFSTDLLAKLISPFAPRQRAELIRAYMRDRLREGHIAEELIASSLGEDDNLFAKFRPDVRTLCAQVGAAVEDDPLFQRTVEDLLALINEDARRQRLYLVAEAKSPEQEIPEVDTGLDQLPEDQPAFVTKKGKLSSGGLPPT